MVVHVHDDDDDGLDAAARERPAAQWRRAQPVDAAHPSAEDAGLLALGRHAVCWPAWTSCPHDQRAAFLLHHEDGFTVEAMAQPPGPQLRDRRGAACATGSKKLRGCMERYLVGAGARGA